MKCAVSDEEVEEEADAWKLPGRAEEGKKEEREREKEREGGGREREGEETLKTTVKLARVCGVPSPLLSSPLLSPSHPVGPVVFGA